MDWDGCGRSPGTDLEDVGWYRRSGMAMEGGVWCELGG